MEQATVVEIEEAARRAVEAAVWAPSVHNTQPWTFQIKGDQILLRADADRRLRVSDTAGRELVISCGAALTNLLVTVCSLGRRADVSVLPDPEAPGLLARVQIGEPVRVDEYVRLLAGEVERRRTHRGAFTDIPVSQELLDRLMQEAAEGGARLIVVRHAAAVRILSSVTEAAQQLQSHNREFTLELLRWATPPGSRRSDGVPAAAYPNAPETAFAQRDYARGQGWGYARPDDEPAERTAGVVAVLTTPGDDRADWLTAGQALQRLLLHCSAVGVSAAFHTQALEIFHLRELLRQELLAGEFPQMIMRLGVTLAESPAVRRPAGDLT